MSEKIEGSCLCGAVRFEIEPPYVGFMQCHCSRCRKSTGSAHGANLFVPIGQFAWSAGEEHVRRFELPDAKYFNHGFCDTCGSSLPCLSRTGRAYAVPAGSLDSDPGARPERTLYWDSRAPWYTPTTELPAYAEGPRRK